MKNSIEMDHDLFGLAVEARLPHTEKAVDGFFVASTFIELGAEAYEEMNIARRAEDKSGMLIKAAECVNLIYLALQKAGALDHLRAEITATGRRDQLRIVR